MTTAKSIEFQELVDKVASFRGRHTELVTVLIPAGQNINIVADQIEAEKSTADNIKSKATRKNVMTALEMISRELKFYKKTHDNGIAIFCGNVSEKEGQDDIKLWIVEPPQELRVRIYRCDKEFVLEPLKAMLDAEEVYGLVALDTKDATFALLEGKQVKILRKITSGIPGKHHAGGQSSQRFERLRDGMVKEFYRRIAENMKELYFNLAKLKGIIIGGPMPTKEDFIKEGQLVTALKDKIIGMIDLGYADEHGIEMIVNESKDILEQQEIMKEKKILDNFFEKLGKGEKVAYKKADIEKAIKYGAVQLLILSNKLKKEEIKEWEKKAESISASVEIVSTETPEGEQFFNLGGIGAILRFEV